MGKNKQPDSTPENSVARIDDSCIHCDLCVPECPSDAIHYESKCYTVDEQLCVLCKGYYTSPNCISICPVRAMEVVSR